MTILPGSDGFLLRNVHLHRATVDVDLLIDNNHMCTYDTVTSDANSHFSLYNSVRNSSHLLGYLIL